MSAPGQPAATTRQHRALQVIAQRALELMEQPPIPDSQHPQHPIPETQHPLRYRPCPPEEYNGFTYIVLYKWLCQSSEPQIPTAAFVCRDLERARSRLDEYRRSSSQKGAEWVSRFVSPVRVRSRAWWSFGRGRLMARIVVFICGLRRRLTCSDP
jgi:hypothetical protein